MKRTYPSAAFLTAFCLYASSANAAAQLSSQSRVYGPLDADLPTPVHSTKTATDAGALQELVNFVKMAGVVNWKGAVGTGTITLGSGTISYPATVSLLGSTGFRLDVKKDAGTESTILNGGRGIFISATGTHQVFSSDVAAPGLFAFTRLLSPAYPVPASVLSDQGLVTVGGASLHRVTLDDPSPDRLGTPWKTADLYFDPQSGKLLRSASFAHLASSDGALYMLQTSYGNYRTVGATTLPYTYSQSLNGQLQWTLTLNSIDPSVVPDSSLFTF